MFKKLSGNIRRHIFLTSPCVALLLSIPPCIAYGADIYDFVRVLVTLLIWVWVTWAVVLWTFRWTILPEGNRNYRILVNQGILFFIGLLMVQVFTLVDLRGVFPHGQLILLVLTISISFNLFVHTVFGLVKAQEEGIKLQVENAALRYAKLQAEVQALKEQINPHFLFNALNISKSLVREDPAGAERYILHLSDFLRSTIQKQEMMVSLADELATCQNYMELQRIRFGKAVSFMVNVSHDHLRNKLPYFAMITLVENAIKHNAVSFTAPLLVNIDTESDRIVVSNNILPRLVPASGTRTGLSNLDERCRLLTGSPINVQDDGRVFKVTIKLTPP